MSGDDPRFRDFVAASHAWLDDYVLYQALKDAHGGMPWYEWEHELVVRDAGCPRGLPRTPQGGDQLPFVRAVRVRASVAGAQRRLAASGESC